MLVINVDEVEVVVIEGEGCEIFIVRGVLVSYL